MTRYQEHEVRNFDQILGVVTYQGWDGCVALPGSFSIMGHKRMHSITFCKPGQHTQPGGSSDGHLCCSFIIVVYTCNTLSPGKPPKKKKESTKFIVVLESK